jgi:hypothetical protein
MRCLSTLTSAACWLVPALALAAETSVSLFTYNAEVFNSASATSNVIQQVNADIVGLQERSVFFGGFSASPLLCTLNSCQSPLPIHYRFRSVFRLLPTYEQPKIPEEICS